MNMAATIDAPAKCELRSVIRFLQAEGRSYAEIHRRMNKGASQTTLCQRHKRPSEKVQLGSFRPSTV
jgi:hypothetical protein